MRDEAAAASGTALKEASSLVEELAAAAAKEAEIDD
jgi:hypothetical protein